MDKPDSQSGEAPSRWQDIGLESLNLITAWKKGAHSLECASIPLTVNVADELREVCAKALETLDELEERQWHPDALNEHDEYLLASFDQLGDESEALRIVLSKEFDVLSASSLPTRNFVFYALIAGPAGRRVAFIRKYNIRRGLRNRLITIFEDSLSKVEGHLFTFDSNIDIVVDPTKGAAILGLSAFQLLFRSSPEFMARTPEYVQDIADTLPMSSSAMATLVEVAQRNMSIQRRLQSIALRGHLSSISIDQVKDEMKRHDLNVEKFIVDGQLVFDRADLKDILKLLNEDLFRGGLTDQDFQVDRKSPR